MEVLIFNLNRDHEEIKEVLFEKFKEVLSQGEYILGKEVSAFEEAFSTYIGVKYTIGVGSGTDALKIGALACGLEKGEKFITTPNTYISTTMALTIHGLIPVFCDIELTTYNLDPNMLEDILKRERGIKLCIPVHLYGHPCMMDEILKICNRYGIMVMEDACQAHGALYKEKKVGSLGDLAAFSFYPTKNLGCYGDGGAITTNSEKIYKKAQMLRIYGQSSKHVHEIEGFNSRLDEVQAALLSIKLKNLDAWNKKRRHIAWLYRKELEDTPVILPSEAEWAYHVYHLYAIRVKERDRLMNYLKENGITTLVHYPTPIHLQSVYKNLGYKRGAYPKSEEVANQILSLPMFPSMKEEEVLYVCGHIREFYGM